MEFLFKNSLMMMERSMDFLWTKQAAILDNIANAETPNYKAKVVTFEESLRQQLERAGHSSSPRRAARAALQEAEITVKEPQDSRRMDENGVNVTQESVELVRNAYQLQYVMNSISGDLNTLRSVIRGQ